MIAAQRLIHLIDCKIKFIKLRLKEMGDAAEQERAFVSHFKYVSELMANNLYPPEDVTEARKFSSSFGVEKLSRKRFILLKLFVPAALIVDFVMEDSQVPNRMEIKARSQEIYMEATRNPFEVVEPKGKKSAKKILKN